jgi:hypothetical protein
MLHSLETTRRQFHPRDNGPNHQTNHEYERQRPSKTVFSGWCECRKSRTGTNNTTADDRIRDVLLKIASKPFTCQFGRPHEPATEGDHERQTQGRNCPKNGANAGSPQRVRKVPQCSSRFCLHTRCLHERCAWISAIGGYYGSMVVQNHNSPDARSFLPSSLFRFKTLALRLPSEWSEKSSPPSFQSVAARRNSSRPKGVNSNIAVVPFRVNDI